MLTQGNFFSFFCLFFRNFQPFFELFEFFLKLTNRGFHILILIKMQFLLLLLFNVLDILQLLLQFVNCAVLKVDLVLQLIEPTYQPTYLSADYVDISFALRSFSTLLYISICL